MQTLTYTIGKDRRALVKDIQNFTIDFNDQGVKNWVQARQYERSMRQVFVNVNNDDDNPFNLTGCNIWFEGVLPDKTHKILDAKHAVILDAQNGQFRFDMPAQAFAVAGSYVQAFFRIVRDGQSITTLEFDLEVLADKVISGLIPSDYITPFEDLYNQLEQIVNNADGKLQDKLNEWNQKLQDLYTSLNKMGIDTQTELQTLQSQIATLKAKADQNKLFTQAEADAFKQSIEDEMSKLADQEKNFEESIKSRTIDVVDYGGTGAGLVDEASAIQAAIDKARNNFFAGNGQTVVQLHGTYLLSKSLILPTYVHLKAAGYTKLVSMVDNGPAIHIEYYDDDLTGDKHTYLHDMYKQMWTGHVLNGDDGGMTIIYKDGQDKANRASSVGIEIGSYDQTDKETPISRFSLSNVMISRFHVAVQYNAQNVYYITHYSLKVQDTDIGMQYGDESHKGGYPNANSGENLNYYGCMFSSCDKVVNSWTDDFSLNFHSTSFDYNDVVFQTNYGFKQISVYGGHIENAQLVFWGNSLEGANAQSFGVNFFGTRFYIADKLNDVLFKTNMPETRIKFDSTMWQLAQVPETTKLCSDNILVDNRNTEWIGINLLPFSLRPGKNLTDYSADTSLFTLDASATSGITTTLGVAQGLPDHKYGPGASLTATTAAGNSSVITTKERPVPSGRNIYYLVPYYIGGLSDKSYQVLKATFKTAEGKEIHSYQSVGALLSRNTGAWNFFSGEIEIPDGAATYSLQIQISNIPNGFTSYIGCPMTVLD